MSSHCINSEHCHIALYAQSRFICWVYVLQARLAALEEFHAIMEDSSAGVQGTGPQGMSHGSLGQQDGQEGAAAQRMAWWRHRLGLDQRMAALLRSLDDSWLGPWR